MYALRRHRRKRLARAALGIMLAASFSLAACDSTDSTDQETPPTAEGGAGAQSDEQGDTPQPDQQGGTPGGGGDVRLMGPPPVDESVDDAVARIEDAVSSGDCETINDLNPLGRPGLATERRCEVLKRLEGLTVVGKAEYGKLGAVIGYERGARTLNVVLVRDADGLLHIAFIDPFTGKSATDGDLAKPFAKVADQGAAALAEKDCEAFLEVAYRRFGLGAGKDRDVCDRVKKNIVAALLERGGEPKALNLAGGSTYAFFGVDTPFSYLTLIAGRQTETGLPKEAPKAIAELPKGAPDYGVVDALRTNPRQPIEAAEDSEGTDGSSN